MGNDGVVMAYGADDLHRGATEQQSAADAAGELARTLAGLRLDPALGTVRSAAGFAQAIGSAQQSQAGGAAGESTRRATVGRHSSTAAGMGTGLTTDTTQLAQSGQPTPAPR